MQRIEVLAALTNGLLLVGIAVWVLLRAVERRNDPAEISSGLMLAVAVLGGVANATGTSPIHRLGGVAMGMVAIYQAATGVQRRGVRQCGFASS